EELYSEIEELRGECPICEVSDYCYYCPLEAAGCGCGEDNSPYERWSSSAPGDTKTRRKTAKQIVDIVTAWEPRE
ncbi:MAG: hypothetical protein LBH26_01565, partial [Treponema sp.]|nr:hypothetical protein [Treponema sp.]